MSARDDPALTALRQACLAAELDLPDGDLPRLAEALTRHRAALGLLRAAVNSDHEPPGFDPRWP